MEDILKQIFNLLGVLINLYSFLCVIRILLTWIPQAQYSKFGQILSSLCDPYLNIFRKIRFLQFRNIDFSPIIAIGLLSLGSSLCTTISLTGKIAIGGILASIISFAWSIIETLAMVIIVIMIIRIIAVFMNKNTSSIWYSIDTIIRPITTFVAKIIFPNKPVSWKKLLIVSTLCLIVAVFVCNFITRLLISIFMKLPF